METNLVRLLGRDELRVEDTVEKDSAYPLDAQTPSASRELRDSAPYTYFGEHWIIATRE